MRDTNHTELSDLNNDLEEYYDEFIEVDDCCGFERKKIVKSTFGGNGRASPVGGQPHQVLFRDEGLL